MEYFQEIMKQYSTKYEHFSVQYGNLLIDNDPYEGVTIRAGKLILPKSSGLGGTLRQKIPSFASLTLTLFNYLFDFIKPFF